jgi:hypothetical protein
MTLEERVREIIEVAGEKPDGIVAGMIAAALRSIRNETWEEAAKVVDARKEKRGEIDLDAEPAFRHIMLANLNAECTSIATAIRSLKHQGG